MDRQKHVAVYDSRTAWVDRGSRSHRIYLYKFSYNKRRSTISSSGARSTASKIDTMP